MLRKTDVVIAGAGVIGSAIARELSKYNLDVTLIEKREDVGGYASKCNSGTLCSGHDAPVGSLEAKLTFEANREYENVCRDLDVEMERIGMIYVAHDDQDMQRLHEIQVKAIQNGEKDARILTGDEVHEMEPSVNPDVIGGLLINNEAIVDVMGLCLAFVENAVDNGVHLMTSTEVLKINKDKSGTKVVSVTTDKGDIECKYVINAAAIYADRLALSVGICDYRNYPRTGQFYVLDKNLPYKPKHIIVPLPTPVSRGKLLTPTIHGNLLVGPSAVNMEDRENTKTDKPTLDEVLADCRRMIPAINPFDSVTQFCGVRPAIDPKTDWRIRVVEGIKGYVEAVGISQGVSAAPAVGRYVAGLLQEDGLSLIPKSQFKAKREAIKRFVSMSEEERNEAIINDPRYGNVICRCETVTEAEIVQAIHREPGAHSVDAIKRRLRAGMGRCQGGFCGPRVVEILARELGVTEEEICKNEKGSEMLVRVNRK